MKLVQGLSRDLLETRKPGKQKKEARQTLALSERREKGNRKGMEGSEGKRGWRGGMGKKGINYEKPMSKFSTSRVWAFTGSRRRRYQVFRKRLRRCLGMLSS